jgi:uncharacterized membrane protein SpoIIM required for sporulation
MLLRVGPKRSPEALSRFAALYREVCADLMRARALAFGLDLLVYLDALAARAHNVLYESRPRRLSLAVDFILREFPRVVRRRWRFVATAAALFLIPLAVGLVGSLASREFAMNVMPRSTLEQLAKSYSEGFEHDRSGDMDAMMAGFYVWNNVGIAFRCFATGILLGLGSVFFLIYNGLAIGAVAGFVTSAGSGRNLGTFIVSHGPYELTALVIAGAAGLLMGYSLIDTGGLTRIDSLRSRGRELVALVSGAAVMLVVAAGFEGFWSPTALPDVVKWIAGGVNVIIVTTFLSAAGRGNPGPGSST